MMWKPLCEAVLFKTLFAFLNNFFVKELFKDEIKLDVAVVWTAKCKLIFYFFFLLFVSSRCHINGSVQSAIAKSSETETNCNDCQEWNRLKSINSYCNASTQTSQQPVTPGVHITYISQPVFKILQFNCNRLSNKHEKITKYMVAAIYGTKLTTFHNDRLSGPKALLKSSTFKHNRIIIIPTWYCAVCKVAITKNLA